MAHVRPFAPLRRADARAVRGEGERMLEFLSARGAGGVKISAG